MPPRPRAAWPGRALLGALVQSVQSGHDDQPRRQARRRPRRVPAGADDPDVVRAADVVRALRADLRRAARGLHAARARAAALDRRARRHRRPGVADDRRCRCARPDGPLRRARDAHRSGHRDAHRRRRRHREPARRALVPHRRAGALDRDSLVPAPRPVRLPCGARVLRDARRHRQRDRRGRPDDRRARPAARSASAGSTRISPTPRTGVPRPLPAHRLVPDGRVRVRAARSRPRSRGAAGSSPPATPRSAR